MKSTNEIKSLTGLRGIAALWIVIYHMHEGDNPQGPFGTMLIHGYNAVDIFFVLSGFVMALRYGHLFDSGFSLRNYRIFLARRVARIYPLYIVTTLLVYLCPRLDNSGNPPITPSVILSNLVLVQNWGLSFSIIPAAWSVSTETAAYLLFPALIALTLYSRPAICAGSVCLLYGALAWLALSPHPGHVGIGPLDIYWARTPWPLARCLLEFTLGLATWRVCTRPGVRRVLSWNPVALVIAAAVLALLTRLNTDLVLMLLVPALIGMLATDTPLPARWLGMRIPMFLGQVSYATYLLHWNIIQLRPALGQYLGRRLSAPHADIAAVCVLYLVILGLGYAAYRLIERPGRAWLRRLEGRRPASSPLPA